MENSLGLLLTQRFLTFRCVPCVKIKDTDDVLPVKPGFHLQQTPRPRHKKQSDYVIEQSSFPLIALFWLRIGRCRGRNWLNGNQALKKARRSRNGNYSFEFWNSRPHDHHSPMLSPLSQRLQLDRKSLLFI